MSLRRKLKPWCWCVPAVLLILIIIVFPIIYTGYISLTNMNLYHWQGLRGDRAGTTMPARFSSLTQDFCPLLVRRCSGRCSTWSYSLPLGFSHSPGAQRTQAEAQPIVQDATDGLPWAMPAYIFHPALARRNVQHRTWSAKQVDHGVGI